MPRTYDTLAPIMPVLPLEDEDLMADREELERQRFHHILTFILLLPILTVGLLLPIIIFLRYDK